MKPYYEHAGITIYHGNCREILPQVWGDAKACVTDPPYGMANNADYSRFSGGNTRRGPGTRHENIAGDNETFDPSLLLNFDKLIIWGANHFWGKLPAGGCAIWIKRNDNAFGTFLSDAEIAYIAGIQGVYCFRRVFAGSQKAVDAGFDAYIPSAHPNQKPVELMTWCLNLVGTPESVCDPFMGSGTTLVAAKLAGLSAIGIEIEEKYCEIAAKRLSQEVFSFGG
jgi:site-specific DNA-methyltransferase (adenine-specific)